MSVWRGLSEKRLLAQNWGIGIPPNSAGFSTDAGENVSDLTALQLIAVQACVRVLADAIASLPLDAYKKSGDLRVELDPQPSLVVQPFENMSTFEGIWQMVTALALRGEVLNVITRRNSLEYATFIEPMHPDFWSIERDWISWPLSANLIYRIAGHRVPNADVQHIKRFSMAQDLHGLSPIRQARMSIGLGLAAERYGARYFGDSASPSSVLETDADLTEEQAAKTQKAWIASHGGRRHPALLSGGLKWKPITITPEESQFLSTRQFQRSEIAMLFGVPPHMIGDVERSTSWGSGIEAQGVGFVTYTLRPWLTCIEAALSALLPRGQYVRFNVDALLRGDSTARALFYTQARNAGWMNVNEIRQKEDMPPVPHGDDYLQPLNFAPLGSDPTKAPTPDKSAPPTGGTE